MCLRRSHALSACAASTEVRPTVQPTTIARACKADGCVRTTYVASTGGPMCVTAVMTHATLLLTREPLRGLPSNNEHPDTHQRQHPQKKLDKHRKSHLTPHYSFRHGGPRRPDQDRVLARCSTRASQHPLAGRSGVRRPARDQQSSSLLVVVLTSRHRTAYWP